MMIRYKIPQGTPIRKGSGNQIAVHGNWELCELSTKDAYYTSDDVISSDRHWMVFSVPHPIWDSVECQVRFIELIYPPEREKMKYVIWSYEHNAWWAPNHSGYTTELQQAGRYSAEEAGAIVTNSIWLEEIAILEKLAEANGAPTCHPYERARQ